MAPVRLSGLERLLACGLGVEAITGKPNKPTTQGKNERFHQSLFRYLDKQPLGESLADLQAQVDAFDHIYHTERPHQGLPGRVTPLTAWEATAKAEPPRPKADQRPWFDRPVPTRNLPPERPPPTDLPTDTRVRKVSTAGTINVDQVFYKIDVEHRSTQVLVITDGDKLTITDLQGELPAEHTRPGPGVTYVGNGRPPGPRQGHLTVTEVLRHHRIPELLSLLFLEHLFDRMRYVVPHRTPSAAVGGR